MTTGRGSKSLILRGPEKNVVEIGGERAQTCVAMTQDGHSDQFFWRVGAAFATLNGFHAPPNFVSHPQTSADYPGAQIGSGWDPHWHQATDVYATFSYSDFRLGLNAAQTTLGAVAKFAGVELNKLSSISQTE